ncbi:hypothetical protein H7H78_19010 [Mycobacterium shinjukuense]|uniref:Lipoprotein n=1 Tax=Mycobacterium shinjukuense TaxID=398694 RepID=A0A7I7MMF9_9MYCO|nr:hypothetical protein [Mycobacterium shinjukuense]MCV6987418.1 hypothetical protein [Mycobacterium shinjukuense]BBX73002.1 hypothetical protein MSHI_09080 [Mycobacterium shinjukuense]
MNARNNMTKLAMRVLGGVLAVLAASLIAGCADYHPLPDGRTPLGMGTAAVAPPEFANE